MNDQDSYVRPEYLAASQWVWDHRDNPGVRIIDCTTQDGYNRAHVPGAVPLGLHNWLKDEDSVHVLNPEAFARRMSELGVGSGTTVVAYDDGFGMMAARLAWVLRHYGHDRVKVLNGGWRHWVSEGRPVSVDTPDIEAADFQPRQNNDIIIRLEELKAKVGQPDVQIVSVLPSAMFTGEANPVNSKHVGHIPGSVNVPTESFMGQADRFASADVIRAAFEGAGVSPDRETIVHCWAGVRSAHASLALNLLGWDRVRVYDASMAEWANRDDTPMVTSVQ